MFSIHENAQKYVLKGAFRDAIRYHFVSVLMQGHEQGWWIYEPEATNREHLNRMGEHSERREALKRLTEIYERAWYGLGNPAKEDFHACEQCLFRMETVS